MTWQSNRYLIIARGSLVCYLRLFFPTYRHQHKYMHVFIIVKKHFFELYLIVLFGSIFELWYVFLILIRLINIVLSFFWKNSGFFYKKYSPPPGNCHQTIWNTTINNYKNLYSIHNIQGADNSWGSYVAHTAIDRGPRIWLV